MRRGCVWPIMPATPRPSLQAYLRQLRRFARTRFPTHYHHLVTPDRARDFLAPAEPPAGRGGYTGLGRFAVRQAEFTEEGSFIIGLEQKERIFR